MADFLKLLEEGKLIERKTEQGKGSKEGRAAIHGSKEKAHTTPGKSRVRIYNSITDALRNGYMGQIFSTKGADRLYVITKRKWGKDDEQEVAGRVAKGFTPGSVPASFKDVKRYSVRTMVRHSGSADKKLKGSKYWKSKRK